jgi:hypothetical protein
LKPKTDFLEWREAPHWEDPRLGAAEFEAAFRSEYPAEQFAKPDQPRRGKVAGWIHNRLNQRKHGRRKFLGGLAAGVLALGLYPAATEQSSPEPSFPTGTNTVVHYPTRAVVHRSSDPWKVSRHELQVLGDTHPTDQEIQNYDRRMAAKNPGVYNYEDASAHFLPEGTELKLP